MRWSLQNLTMSQRLRTHLSIPHEEAHVLAFQLLACTKSSFLSNLTLQVRKTQIGRIDNAD